MRILFISPNSPFESIGGIERYIDNLIGYYKNRSGSDIYILLPTTGRSRKKVVGKVTIYFDHNFSIPKDFSYTQKETTKRAHLFSDLLETLIKKHGIQAICAENILSGPPAVYSLLLNMAVSRHKIPLILRLHSFATSDLQIELVNQLMWNKISCVSKSVAGDCFQKGAEVSNLATHYLGVNTKEFNNAGNSRNKLKKDLGLGPESKIVLTASRIIRGRRNILKEKGIINLIQAFSKLSPRFPNLKLLIAIGKAPANLKTEFDGAYEMLLGYIKLHNIEASTIVKMFKLHEMAGVYRGSDVFALPSENETFGQVFIESMACGLPVIGTKTGGIPEIISDSYNGFLIQPDDSSILAQRIEKLIGENDTREQFIKAGVKTVMERFDSTNQFADFQEMLKRIIH